MVLETWTPLIDEEKRPFMQQMAENIGKIRKATILWSKEFWKKHEVEIAALKEKISSLMMANEDGSFSDQEEATIKELLCKKHDFLRKEESGWRQKSRAVWIKEEDSNTKFFHKFASFRKVSNSIWELRMMLGKR